MAHDRQGPDIVANIRYAGASAVRAVSDHERNRTPDGASAIDPKRSHLNTVLVGPATQQAALDALWASGVKPPAKQSETPYVQMVLSASPGYFRREGQGPGEWDDDRLTTWREATMRWLREEYGDDLVHASIHLDEDTPHIHALIVPTYSKKARKPGKRKRGETEEAFEARKADALASTGVRSAGRSSSEIWARPFARRHARKSYHTAVEGLGLGYGRDFIEEGEPSPSGQTTAQWVRQKAAELAALGPQVEAQAQAILEEAARDAAQMRLEAEAEATAAFAKAAAEAEARASAYAALTEMFKNRALERGVDLSPLRPGLPHIKPAAEALVHAQYHEARRIEELDARASDLDERASALDKRDADLDQREADLVAKEAEVEADLREIREHRDWWRTVRNTMAGYLEQVAGWLRRPDLPAPARKAAEKLVEQGDDIEREVLLAPKSRVAARIIAVRDRSEPDRARSVPEQSSEEPSGPGF